MTKHSRNKRTKPVPFAPKQLVDQGGFTPSIGDAPWTAEAIKTYLQEQVALLRPQVSFTEMAHLFRFGVTVWSAASYRAENLRQVDYKLADANGKPIISEDPLVKSINQALKRGFKSLIERSEISHCFYGEVLWHRERYQNGMLSNFQWVNNNFWQRDTGTWDGLKGFRIRAVWDSDLDADLYYIPIEDSVYMHNVDFFEDYGGIGPAQVCYVQAATETEIAATQLQFFRNMAMPALVMQPAKDSGFRPGPDQKTELTELMRRMYQGAANAGRTAVLPTRWEIVQLQQDFDKLGMPDLSEKAVDAVIRVMRVPLELLDPRQNSKASGTKFYDQKREWLLSWLVPQAERYADELTEQVAQPINPDWQVLATFSRVRGLDEDVDSRTKTVTKQVADSLLDIYSGQKILGIRPDRNLKGVYMISGVPVPSEAIRDYYKMAPGSPGIGGALGGEQPDTKPTISTPETQGTPRTDTSNEEDKKPTVDTGKAIPFLPDAQYHELKKWRFVTERKGKDYAFKGEFLPSHAVAFGRLLLATDESSDATWNAIRVQAVKGYEDTENQYRTSLYELMTDAMIGSLDRNQFGVAGRGNIDNAFTSAFKNGLQEGGVDPAEMTDEEAAALALEIKAERSYWTGLANDMYRRLIPLKGTDAFVAARDAMLGRIELWVNKGLYRVKQLGGMYAKMNGMKKFVFGGTIDHCGTCSGANGQVHRNRTWLKWNIYPRADSCICGGFKCDCTLEDTTEPAHGSLASVPTAGGAKSEDDHEDHVHDEGRIADVPLPEAAEMVIEEAVV